MPAGWIWLYRQIWNSWSKNGINRFRLSDVRHLSYPSGGFPALGRRHGSTNTQRWLVAYDRSRSFSRKKRRETTGREIWWPRFFFGELKGRWENLRNFGRYSEHFPWLFIGVLEWDFASLLVWNPLAGTMIFEYVCLKDRADRSNQTSWWCGFERIQIWRHKQCVPSKQHSLVAFNLDLEEGDHCFIVNSL